MSLFLESLSHKFAEVCWRFGYVYATLAHYLHLGGCGVGLATDDCACVSHTTTLGCCLSGDETNYGLGAVFLDPICRVGLHTAANLADHNDAFGLGVCHEEFYSVESGGANDGVAADADGGGLTKTGFCHLVNGFVSQCA